MKMSKKVLSLLISGMIAGSLLVGCGSNEAANSSNTTTNSEVVVEDTQESTGEVVEDTQVSQDAEGTEQTETVEDEYTNADPTPAQELFFVVTDGLELPKSMEMPADVFADSYGINTDLLDSYYVAMPMMNVTATEIAVFEVKDTASIEEVKAGIEKRQKALEAQWASYLPQQYDLVQNYKVEVKDNKVIFVISEVADQIIEKFNAAQ